MNHNWVRLFIILIILIVQSGISKLIQAYENIVFSLCAEDPFPETLQEAPVGIMPQNECIKQHEGLHEVHNSEICGTSGGNGEPRACLVSFVNQSRRF